MQKVSWIIENFTDSEDYRDLIRAAKESGRQCFVIDRKNNFDFDPNWISDNSLVVFQGSIQMTRLVKNKLGAKGCLPIAFCNEEKFECLNYYSCFDHLLFNDKYIFCPVWYLKKYRFDVYARFGKEALIFVRPNKGDKLFSGQLLDLQDFDRFWSNNIVCNADDGEFVIVSTPKNIRGEYRFVVSATKEIIAHSTYIYQGQKTLIPAVPKGATEKCREILEIDYRPDLIYCIDVVEDNDGNFWLLELTSFSSAGLYACDKNKIVDRVSKLTEEHYVQQ